MKKIHATITVDFLTHTDDWDVEVDESGRFYILPLTTSAIKDGKDILIEHRLYLDMAQISHGPEETQECPTYLVSLDTKDATTIET